MFVYLSLFCCCFFSSFEINVVRSASYNTVNTVNIVNIVENFTAALREDFEETQAPHYETQVGSNREFECLCHLYHSNTANLAINTFYDKRALTSVNSGTERLVKSRLGFSVNSMVACAPKTARDMSTQDVTRGLSCVTS